jgi:methylated-DNA-[protein]-cysteine S-methyltransferase
MKTIYTMYESPLGMIRMLANGDGLLRLEFEDEKKSLLFYGAKFARNDFGAFTKELDAYFAGELKEFTIPVILDGSAFQQRVWEALLAIPYGQTCSYLDIAGSIGNTRAARAVGAAVRQNPVAIIIPCHRVIGSTGRLVGYGGGLWRKEALLEIEKKNQNPAIPSVSAKAS